MRQAARSRAPAVRLEWASPRSCDQPIDRPSWPTADSAQLPSRCAPDTSPAAKRRFGYISVCCAENREPVDCHSYLSENQHRNPHCWQEIVRLLRGGLSGSASGKTVRLGRYVMSQSTDELTRSELRAIRGHYRRRVWLAFLIPALVAVALGWLLFQDQDARTAIERVHTKQRAADRSRDTQPTSERTSQPRPPNRRAGLVRSGPPASYFPRK